MEANRYGKAFASFYDRHFSDYAEKAAPILLRFFHNQPVSRGCPRVLDLGCGPGHLALRFLGADYTVTGLDLSIPMLELAQGRTARYMATAKAHFFPADISSFQVDFPYGLALATYNVMNHLESEAALRGCFKCVKSTLGPGGVFLFDLHTKLGLEEWAQRESAKFKDGEVGTEGSYDAAKGRAVMKLKGSFQGEDFEETIVNQAYDLDRVRADLLDAGFKSARFSRMDKLEEPLADPEGEKRVVVVAGT